jgi:hypothetical protein
MNHALPETLYWERSSGTGSKPVRSGKVLGACGNTVPGASVVESWAAGTPRAPFASETIGVSRADLIFMPDAEQRLRRTVTAAKY